MLAAPVLGWFFVGFGAACAVVPLVWEYALRQYRGAEALPTQVTAALIAGTVVVFAVLAFWKIAAFNRGARAVDSRYSWLDVMRDLTSHPVVLYQQVIMAGTAVAVVMAIRTGNAYLVPAALAAGLAMVFMLYAVAFLLNEYSFIIVWLSLFAAAVLFLPGIPPLIMAAVGFGGGFLLYGIYSITMAPHPASSTHGGNQA